MKIIFSDKKPGDAALVILRKGHESVVAVQGGRKVIYIGLGNGGKLNRRKLVILARKIIVLAKSSKISRITLDFKDFVKNFEVAEKELAEILAVNFEMANFEFVKYKSRPRDGWNFVKEIFVFGKITPEIKNGFKKGQIVGGEVNACRVLANTPGGEMTPAVLADAAKLAVKNLPVKASVLSKKEMEGLKMGGVLGVAKGAKEESKFIIMEYMAGSPKDKPVVLIGKGVTFDTGGLNIKTGEGMYEMHMDMSGASAVIHAIVVAAKLKIAKNIIGLIPAVENMPSNESFRPGDIFRMMSGRTVEIINTDAEGRIILADAL
ncbi:MAG: M17 family peptidase N-terminal domain-containing protein, partial [Patescibacteria group bacterium]